MEGRKQDQKKLAAGMTEIEQLYQTIERCVGALYCTCKHVATVCASSLKFFSD